MEISKGNFGECKFIDCIQGLTDLQDHYQLCLTDYPYNVKYTGKSTGGIVYTDNKERMDYIQWCKEVFQLIQSKTEFQLIFCGNPNVSSWCKYIQEPDDIAIHYKKNCQSIGRGYHLPRHDMILMYGKFNNQHKLSTSVIVKNIKIHDYDHPCPGTEDVYKEIIKQMKCNSVIDPFLGSGTTAEVCEELGIKWLGFEINLAYKSDIERRIKVGIERHNSLKKLSRYQ